MRAFDQAGVEGNDIHERAEPQRILRQPPTERELGEADGRVEKKLDRIEPGLAVNLDQAGEIRGASVVKPIVVGEPGVGPGQGDEFTRARVIETERMLLAPIKHALDTGQGRDRAPDLFDEVWIAHVYMRDLMIRHGKRPTLREIEEFSAILDADGEQPSLAQRAIDVDRSRYRRDAVFGEDDHAGAVALRIGNEVTGNLIDLCERRGDA